MKSSKINNDKYKSLFISSRDAVMTLEPPDWKFTSGNPATIKMFNAKNEADFLSYEPWKLSPLLQADGRQSKEKAKEMIDIAMKNGSNLFEWTHKRLNGEEFPAEVLLSKVQLNEGSFLHALVRDITERKKLTEKAKKYTQELEEKVSKQVIMLKEKITDLENSRKAASNLLSDLEEEHTKLTEIRAKDEAMLSSIGEGLIAVNNYKRIIFTNKIAADMLGWDIKDLIGKAITDFLLESEAGDPIPLNKRPTTIALATDEISKATYFFVRQDKTRFPIAITATPIKLNGKTIGLVEIIRDISHEKAIDKAKTEFISLASHQLRTPLTTISWYTEMILKGDGGKVTPGQKKYLKEVYAGNKRMIELVNTLLNVSRLELGTFTNKPERVLLKDVAESVLEELKLQIKAQKLTIDKNYDPSLPVISADPKLIRIIFQNLLSNAIKYVGVNGKITLDISLEKLNFLIKVWNNGMEIPKEAQPKIFTKLFRDDLAKQKDPEGNGLGLYIVKSIVENVDGKIWFESPTEKDGTGVAFYVTIPLDKVKIK